jgi:hypothetical protein
VTSNSSLIQHIRSTQSLALTIIGASTLVDTIAISLQAQYPNVFIDKIALDSVDAVRELLNARVQANRRFD